MLQIRSQYLAFNPQQDKGDARFMWRFELFTKLYQERDIRDRENNEIINYAAGDQLEKLYKTLYDKDYVDKNALVNKMKEPKGVSQFDKLVEKNPVLLSCATHIHDMTHPLFAASLNELMKSCTKDYPYALKYLTMIKKYYDAQDADMVYALGIILRNHKK